MLGCRNPASAVGGELLMPVLCYVVLCCALQARSLSYSTCSPRFMPRYAMIPHIICLCDKATSCYLPRAISFMLSFACNLPRLLFLVLSCSCYRRHVIFIMLSSACYRPHVITLSSSCCLHHTFSFVLARVIFPMF
jgi:hypothetical protein